MLTPEGRAKIADFGMASRSNSGLTLAGTMIGTPAYMSPEQFMVRRSIRAATSIRRALSCINS